MQVYWSTATYLAEHRGPCVATLGTFDGFHRGHAAIFEQLSRTAEAQHLPAVAITFHPHPRVLVTPDDPPQLLTTPEEKIELLTDAFDGSLVFVTFDDFLRRMTAEQFAREILLGQFEIRSLVVGYNHSFGHLRSGNIDNLATIAAKGGFDLQVTGPVTFRDIPISSSRIRRVVKSGDWDDAVSMLGHPYPIRGKVIRGIGQGRKMGWPTINLAWPERKLLPMAGVYSCSAAAVGAEYRGMMFIGVNMLNPHQVLSVEAHLFDFDGEVYDAEATIYPLHFIRPNVRFDTIDALSRQIAKDKETVLKLIQ